MTIPQPPALINDRKAFAPVLEARSKSLPSDVWSYKLSNPETYGLDVAVTDDMQINESDMSAWIPIASGAERDGVGDVVIVEGINTSRHILNPQCLLDHGKFVQLPIGLAETRESPYEYTYQMDPINKKAGVRCFFYMGKNDQRQWKSLEQDNGKQYDHALMVEQCFDMMVKRLLRAGSIGYSVLDAEHIPPDYVKGYPQGLLLRKVLLLEGSLVIMPANPRTVLQKWGAKSLSFATSPEVYDEWSENVRCVLSAGKLCGKTLSPVLVKSLQPFAPALTKIVSGYEGEAMTQAEENKADESNAVNQIPAEIDRGQRGNKGIMGKYEGPIPAPTATITWQVDGKRRHANYTVKRPGVPGKLEPSEKRGSVQEALLKLQGVRTVKDELTRFGWDPDEIKVVMDAFAREGYKSLPASGTKSANDNANPIPLGTRIQADVGDFGIVVERELTPEQWYRYRIDWDTYTAKEQWGDWMYASNLTTVVSNPLAGPLELETQDAINHGSFTELQAGIKSIRMKYRQKALQGNTKGLNWNNLQADANGHHYQLIDEGSGLWGLKVDGKIEASGVRDIASVTRKAESHAKKNRSMTAVVLNWTPVTGGGEQATYGGHTWTVRTTIPAYRGASTQWILEKDGRKVAGSGRADTLKQKATQLAAEDTKSIPPSRWKPGLGAVKGQPSDDISPEKAKEVLKDESVHGHPLTEKQRDLFGAAAGKDKKALRAKYKGGSHREEAEKLTQALTQAAGQSPSHAVGGDPSRPNFAWENIKNPSSLVAKIEQAAASVGWKPNYISPLDSRSFLSASFYRKSLDQNFIEIDSERGFKLVKTPSNELVILSPTGTPITEPPKAKPTTKKNWKEKIQWTFSGGVPSREIAYKSLDEDILQVLRSSTRRDLSAQQIAAELNKQVGEVRPILRTLADQGKVRSGMMGGQVTYVAKSMGMVGVKMGTRDAALSLHLSENDFLRLATAAGVKPGRVTTNIQSANSSKKPGSRGSPTAVSDNWTDNQLRKIAQFRSENEEVYVRVSADSGLPTIFGKTSNAAMSQYPTMQEAQTQADKMNKKRGYKSIGSHAQKSLSDLRKKYKTVKGLRRKLRKSVAGSSMMYAHEKDLDKLRTDAEAKGIKTSLMGSKGNLVKIKLIGGNDDSVDELTKNYGRRPRG